MLLSVNKTVLITSIHLLFYPENLKVHIYENENLLNLKYEQIHEEDENLLKFKKMFKANPNKSYKISLGFSEHSCWPSMLNTARVFKSIVDDQPFEFNLKEINFDLHIIKGFEFCIPSYVLD